MSFQLILFNLIGKEALCADADAADQFPTNPIWPNR
jgi:hypothetical protein